MGHQLSMGHISLRRSHAARNGAFNRKAGTQRNPSETLSAEKTWLKRWSFGTFFVLLTLQPLIFSRVRTETGVASLCFSTSAHTRLCQCADFVDLVEAGDDLGVGLLHRVLRRAFDNAVFVFLHHRAVARRTPSRARVTL